MTEDESAKISPVLHVVVIGFHHKKGCQVDYSYPPLIEGNPVNSHEVPAEWKHLPSLAIPDGAHNYTKDTVYFHLPSRDGQFKTVYGVACYRQIDSSALLKKSSDVTRSTVQKSVCVLSRLPLYGLIQAKLELITHAYFDELDFTKVELLEDTYKNLCLSMTESLRDGSQVFLGMSIRDVVVQFRHKIIMLFKLILLERRVLFTGAPVQSLCSTILTVLSLFPGMIEFGLEESATVEQNRQLSPTLRQTQSSDSTEDFLEVCYHDEKGSVTISKDSISYTSQLSQCSTTSGCDEPEVLEIPRDGSGVVTCSDEAAAKIDQSDNNKGSRHSSDTKICDKEKTCDEQTRTLRSLSDVGETTKTEKNLGRYNVKRTLSDSFGLYSDKSILSGSLKNESPFAVSSDKEPLSNMRDITHLEVVQTGQMLRQTDSVVNVEEFSDNLEKLDNLESLSDDEEPSKYELSLNLEDAREVLKRSEGVEELDSPESIQKIDQEDCFSWEEDRLLLTFDHKDSVSEPDIIGVGTDVTQSESNQDSNNTHDSGIDIINTPKKEEETKSPNVDESSVNSTKENSDTEEIKSPGKRTAVLRSKISSAFSGLNVKERMKARRSGNNQDKSKSNDSTEMNVIHRDSGLIQDDSGFPLAIFTKGCVCHPYLSLQYYDLLSDVNVRGFVIGATNILFRQKRHLTDIVIEVSDSEAGKIEIHDKELQKLLHLTTADLRFADIILRAVIGENGDEQDDLYLDGTEWEGGDEWLQAQFRLYLQSLLVSMKRNDSKILEDFGTPFCHAFRTTYCYKQWSKTQHPAMSDVHLGHPCQGNLGVSDIRMRLAHNLQNTERGKKINAAMVQTGRYMEQAGKAVGGAIVNAKSAVSSWWSSWKQPKGDNSS